MSSTDAGPRSAIRWLLAAVVLLVGTAAVTKSASLALAGRRPETALKLDPWSSAALSNLAVRDVQQARDPKALAAAGALARRAVALDPTNASALGAFAFGASDKAASARALRASEALSRRSLVTQLALIEEAVARDDVPGALRHYDIALRTSRGAASILFPVLVPAGTDAELMPDIARFLAKGPPWGELYQMQLAQSATDYTGVAALFARLRALGARPSPTAVASFFQRAIDAQAYAAAWRVYAADRGAADRAGLRNGDFRRVPERPVPFDWTLADGGAVTAEIVPGVGGGSGRLTFAANMGEGGLVARQLVMLAPGTHTLRGRAEGIVAPADARPYWRLDCAITGAELSRQSFANGGFSFAMTVPAGCTAQWLSLMVLPPSGTEAIEGAVAGLSLR